MNKGEAAGLALVQFPVVIQQICLAMYADAHRPDNRVGNRVAVGCHFKRISRRRVAGNKPVRVGSAFKIAGSGLPSRATRESESSLGHFAPGLGRGNRNMAFRADVAAHIALGGRWRFGRPPTVAGDAIGGGIRQLVTSRVLLGVSGKRRKKTQPANERHPNP